ncbi:putative reverse transcriptase domain-containing protein [Tanacetum coccineum]
MSSLDGLSCIFLYEVEGDKTPPPRDESSDYEPLNTEPPNAESSDSVSSDSEPSDSESEDEEADIALEATVGTVTQRPFAVRDFPRGILEDLFHHALRSLILRLCQCPLDFVFSSEIFKSLSFSLDRLCLLAILCLDQHAHTLHHLESLLTISLDRLDILKEDLFEHEHVVMNSTSAGIRHHHLHLYVEFKRFSLTGFPAQSVGSSNTYVLDLPCLLVLITGTSQSRQHGKSESDSYYLSDYVVNSFTENGLFVNH